MHKNPIKKLDGLVIEHDWLGVRELLSSLGPLQAAHTVLTTMIWFDRCSDERDWELFEENLSGIYLSSNIPDWCLMPEHEHQIAGGCWGILHGEVATNGREHCAGCEYNAQ